MSLVNDMLRDLDSRRRDGGGPAVAREKLIPANDSQRKAVRTSTLSRWLVPVLILAVAAGTVLVWRIQRVEQIPAPAFATVTESQSAAPLVLEPRVDQAILEEMERMSRRVQELEQRNMSLQSQVEAVAAADMPAEEVFTQSDAAVLEPGESAVQSNVSGPAVVSTTPTQSDVAAGIAQDNSSAPASALAPEASTLVRMPAQMNFRELDLQQVQTALALWQQGQQAPALDALRAFAAANPQAHQSRETLAKLLLQQGDMIAAMEQADAGLSIQPDHYGYKKVKARVMMTAGVPGEAADLLAVRAPSLAGDSEYHELLAASLLASQQYAQALQSYQALSASAPQDARWWYGVAAAQDALGRSFEAVQSYERALQLGGLTTALRQNSQQRIASIRQN